MRYSDAYVVVLFCAPSIILQGLMIIGVNFLKLHIHSSQMPQQPFKISDTKL